MTPATTACADIARMRYDDEVVTLDKHRDQTNYAVFTGWIRGEARKRCEGGYCPRGKCHGHAEVGSWELVEETAQTFSCRFSGELFCRCD